MASGGVYSNFGDWPSIRESLLIATKIGESSTAAVDFALIAYVLLYNTGLKFLGKFHIRVRHASIVL